MSKLCNTALYCRFWMLLMAVLMSVLAPQAAAEVLVVLSQDRAVYRDVARAMDARYGGSLRVVSLSQLKSEPALMAPTGDITVSVGAAASEYLLQQLPTSRSLLATFLPESAYQSLLTQYGNRWLPHRSKLSAIYLDQPLKRQLALARLILPKARTIGSVVGRSTQYRLNELRQAARQQGFELIHTSLAKTDNPVKQLQPIIQQSDVFMPLPDQAVFNRTTAKWILYIAYRQRVPLIGFSRKYVEAGAVAAVYSSPEQLGRQGGEFLQRYNQEQSALPAPQPPVYFDVITNRVAARSLQLRLPADEVLTERLREME